jgi:hypothetical protein
LSQNQKTDELLLLHSYRSFDNKSPRTFAVWARDHPVVFHFAIKYQEPIQYVVSDVKFLGYSMPCLRSGERLRVVEDASLFHYNTIAIGPEKVKGVAMVVAAFLEDDDNGIMKQELTFIFCASGSFKIKIKTNQTKPDKTKLNKKQNKQNRIK